MEKSHREAIRKRYRTALGSRPMIVIGIPDEFEYMQEELVVLLKERVPPFLV